MEYLKEIWPFVPGQQETIFQVTGIAVISLIFLNVISAIRQKLPVSKILSSFFTFIPNQTKTEKVIGRILLTILVMGFFVTVLDVVVNGNQLVKTGF